jgi:DNA-binding IclR family transcriptional regulator
MGEDAKTKLVPAVERATRILDLVARSRAGLTVSEIARELSLAKSSAHLICNTLQTLDLLIRRDDQTFQIGPHVMRWANAFELNSDVATEFASIWDKETELPGATITLSVLQEGEVVYLAARNSSASAALFDFRAGMRLPAAFTATGKAFLSHMTEFEVRRLYSHGFPPPRTPHSVRTVEALIEELARVRANGYSCDNEQVAEGIVCFGASVLNSNNKPIAGVAVSILRERLDDIESDKIIQNVQRIASRLSFRMGAALEYL